METPIVGTSGLRIIAMTLENVAILVVDGSMTHDAVSILTDVVLMLREYADRGLSIKA